MKKTLGESFLEDLSKIKSHENGKLNRHRIRRQVVSLVTVLIIILAAISLGQIGYFFIKWLIN